MSATTAAIAVWMAVSHIAQELGVDPSAPVRWITRGNLLSDGSRIHLKAVKTPGGWRIKREDLDRFLETLTADRLKPEATDAPRPARGPRVAKLKADLAKNGF